MTQPRVLEGAASEGRRKASKENILEVESASRKRVNKSGERVKRDDARETETSVLK